MMFPYFIPKNYKLVIKDIELSTDNLTIKYTSITDFEADETIIDDSNLNITYKIDLTEKKKKVRFRPRIK